MVTNVGENVQKFDLQSYMSGRNVKGYSHSVKLFWTFFKNLSKQLQPAIHSWAFIPGKLKPMCTQIPVHESLIAVLFIKANNGGGET